MIGSILMAATVAQAQPPVQVPASAELARRDCERLPTLSAVPVDERPQPRKRPCGPIPA